MENFSAQQLNRFQEIEQILADFNRKSGNGEKVDPPAISDDEMQQYGIYKGNQLADSMQHLVDEANNAR